MANPFQKAIKEQSKLRLAISSPAGFGKTYTALRMARRLAEQCGGRVALVDTEHGSASKYADEFDFDHALLHAPFSPERYIEMIRQAEAAGYPVLVLDSASHEWNGSGGCLELVDDASRRNFNGNKWAAWSEVTPKHNRFIETILASGMHIIATYRSKVETSQVMEGGRQKVQKLGMEAIAREGTDYEFDVVGEIDSAHRMAITKTRCKALTDREFAFPGEDVADILIAWLLDGAPAAPKPTPVPPQEPTKTRLSSTTQPTNGQTKARMATKEQFDAIARLAEKAGTAKEKLGGICQELFNHDKTHLTFDEAIQWMEAFEQEIALRASVPAPVAPAEA